MVPAYEERYLCFVLALARSRHTRVTYVTSLPVLPRLASYHLDLVRNLNPADAANRLTVVFIGDPSPGPTNGMYDEPSGQHVARTGHKHYVATDHLEHPTYARLTPDDVLDVVDVARVGWDPESETGVALHMVSGVAVGGSIGATAIADSCDDVDRLMGRLRAALDDAAAGVPS